MNFRYEPDKCPFGKCDEHQLVDIEGPVKDCDLCKNLHLYIDLTEKKNKKYIREGIQTAITVDFEDNKYSYMSNVLSAMSRLLQELGEMLVTETKNINTYCKDIFRNANIFLLELLNIWGGTAEKEKENCDE